MGLFSNIVDSFKDSLSSIADTAVNLLGNITDSFKPDRPPINVTGSYGGMNDYSYEIDDIYTDYIEWFDTFDS